jgi:hypothetical protein
MGIDWDGAVALLVERFDQLIDSVPEKIKQFLERYGGTGIAQASPSQQTLAAATQSAAAAKKSTRAKRSRNDWNDLVHELKSEGAKAAADFPDQILERIKGQRTAP